MVGEKLPISSKLRWVQYYYIVWLLRQHTELKNKGQTKYIWAVGVSHVKFYFFVQVELGTESGF